MMKGTIFNILRYCIHDGPGIRTTVFLKGCPLTCWWCQNPEGLNVKKELFYQAERCLQCGDCLEVCPYNAIEKRDGLFLTMNGKCQLSGLCVEVCNSGARQLIGREVTVREVMKEIKKDVVFFEESNGGVTFSGGEPLMQPDFLEELLKCCKEAGIRTAVDTSGYALPESINKITPYTDLFLYDLKSIDDRLHQKHTGVSNELIIENLRGLISHQHDVIIRIPVIPGVNDKIEILSEIGQFVASLGNIEEIHLLPYHQTGVEKYRRFGLDYRKPQPGSVSQKKLDTMRNKLMKLGMQVKIGG